MSIINYFIITFLALSVLSFLLAVIGVIRLPDFYARVHAASIGDTLSTMMLLVAVILYVLGSGVNAQNIEVSLKIFLILAFMFLTGPTGVHTLINAGYELGKKPYTKKTVNENETLQTNSELDCNINKEEE